ncbi:PadR family transcriptional regulator [Hamadaea sp.]|uniref:PadR family transcriptional regulator n=1 Tax=Hamadaea sp. TaxID=2024425 RepID=UPI0025BB605B|nr:PadR family transcriptional regulator [Hamadaea sp.]
MEELGGLGRFADPAVLILTSLAEGPKHGYALIQDVGEFAGISLGPGTLYGALSRLEQRGLIQALPAEDRRRPYRITPDGAAALKSYLEHAQAVARRGLRHLGAYA